MTGSKVARDKRRRQENAPIPETVDDELYSLYSEE